ncbi:hypothetical protein [Amycolatopsis ultiminotia]|uniref:hypothetical protein n=1 Tax=Amycolatopsis ultiminotia TaxID=543629 RepID=UPI0031E95304
MSPQAPPPRKRRRLWLKLGLPLVLVVVLVGGFVVFLYGEAGGFRSAQEKDLNSGSATDPLEYGVNIAAGDTHQYATDVPGYTPGATPDAGQLAGVDPRQFYFAVLKRQGMVKVSEVIHASYLTEDLFRSTWPGGLVEHSVVDWQTRKFIKETQEVSSADGKLQHSETLRRCIEGNQEAQYTAADPAFGFPAKWETEPEDSHSCSRRMQPTWDVENVGTSDGVMPGGLTADELDRYLSYVDHVPGLLDVRKPTVFTGTDGKQYLRLDVRIVPQDGKVEDQDRQGVAFLNAGFAQTGKKPSDYPLIVGAGTNQGRHFQYYLDPQTLLPAYSAAVDTQPVKLDGTTDTGEDQNLVRTLYEYKYPHQLDPARTHSGGPTDVGYTAPPFPRPDLPDR